MAWTLDCPKSSINDPRNVKNATTPHPSQADFKNSKNSMQTSKNDRKMTKISKKMSNVSQIH